MLKKNNPKKTSLKSPKITKNNNSLISQKSLKEAYQVVQSDLMKKFLQLKANQSLRLNGLGTFKKSQISLYSGLDKNTYLYWKISFSMATNLKRELEATL